MKKYYLSAMEELLRLDEARALSAVADEVVEQLQTVLEAQDSAELMQANVACIRAALHRYPAAFQPHFKDFVDILVGWHIDPSQPQWVEELASRSLRQLKSFWAADAAFGVLLTGQFIEDMESYAQELKEMREKPGDAETELLCQDSCSKILELIKVYTSVMLALSAASDATPGHPAAATATTGSSGSPISGATCAHNLRMIVDCLIAVADRDFSDQLVVAGCTALGHLVTLLGQRLGGDMAALLQFLDLIWQHLDSLADLTLVSLCQLLQNVLRHGSTVLPPDLMRRLFGAGSPLLKLRSSSSEPVRSAMLATYHAALALKNVPLLQDVYQCLLQDLHNSYLEVTGIRTDLAAAPHTTPNVDDVTHKMGDVTVNAPNSAPAAEEEMEEEGRRSSQEALDTVVFCLQALAELASTRNSIIGLWALSPSIVELLAVSLKPADPRLASSHPVLRHMIVTLLYSHSDKHRHFLSTSRLMRSERTPPALASAVAPSTGQNLGTLLTLLRRLLLQEETLPDTERLCLLWTAELTEAVAAGGYTDQLLRSPELEDLLLAAAGRALSRHRPLSDLAAEMCGRAVYAVTWDKLPASVRHRLCEAGAARLDAPTAADLASLPLISRIPPDQLLETLAGSAPADDVTAGSVTSRLVRARRHLRTHQVSVAAHADTYRRFVDTITADRPLDCVADSLRACQNAGVSQKADDAWMLPSRGSLLKLWSCLAPAEFCVQHRLKTPPHRKPERTLTELDDKLRDCAAAGGAGLRLLVAFLETLDQCLHAASNGVAVMPTVFSKAVRSFFRANATTCSDWLLRARRHLISPLPSGASRLITLPAAARLALVAPLLAAGKNTSVRSHQQVALAALAAGSDDLLLGLRNVTEKQHGKKVEDGWMEAAELVAKQRYSEGAEGLKLYVLRHVKAEAVDPDLLHELGGRVLESYVSVGRYEDAVAWRETMRNHQLTVQDPTLDNVDHIRLLASFADEDYSAVTSHAVSLPSSGDRGNCTAVTAQLYTSSAVAALVVGGERWQRMSDRLPAMAAEVAALVHSEVTEFPPVVPPAALFSLQALQQLMTVKEGGVSSLRLPDLSTSSWRSDALDTTTMLMMTHWCRCLQRAGATAQSDPGPARLRLMTVKRLRRTGETSAAAALLLRTPLSSDDAPALSPVRDRDETVDRLKSMVTSRETVTPLVETRREAAKLLHSLGETQSAAEALLATPTDDVTSRTDLLLARWLREGGADVWLEPRLVEGYLSGLQSGVLGHVSGHSVPAEQLQVGRLLEASVQRCPDDSKAWYQFADWCYTWGKQAVQDARSRSSEQQAGNRSAVAALMPDVTDDVIDQLTEIVESSGHQQDDPDNDIEDAFVPSSAYVRRRLAAVAPSDIRVDALLELWRTAQSALYGHLGLAAAAYFRYLQLQHESNTSGCERSTLAALRLLRLIVKHAAELRDQLLEGLADTPTPPWKAIIPQLFARLDHPEPYVRSAISRLLCAVADDDPQLIVFPAVVGSDTCRTAPEPESDTEKDGDDSARMLDCYTGLVDTLRNTNPAAMRDVTLLVRELRRVTLLWDELWCGALQQHQAEVQRRLTTLTAELAKVADREALTEPERTAIAGDKYRITVSPVLYVLDRLHAITSVEPETPHEQAFQKLYLADIEAALAALRDPADPWCPRAAWEPFRRLATALQQRMSGRAAQALSLRQISPVLAGLKDTAVCMPGVAGATSLMVAAIEHSVLILPTKTKPKKLQLLGSDGRRYAYLFKGLEDLHLDERIMQLLAITNQMLSRHKQNGQVYRARRYAVVPLGPRSGLIQWVDGSTPLFGIYKRWQQRAATANGTAGPLQTPVPRPSELFNAALQPVLRSRGLPADSSRRDWPTDVLTSVLQQLEQDTPADILARELWSSSSSAAAWWSTTQAYCRSMAVMSMTGYVLGLGDRHLDNLLLDLTTGEVVHIDYNVCFEKGRSLRIPERVPYRMTQNLRAALGPTGVEGPFRRGCERVLSTLRAGSETLLTLLEAFVYDPLVDWTPAHDAGYTGAVYGGEQAALGGCGRREMERTMTISLFCVQVAEMKPEWSENKSAVTASLTELSERLSTYLGLHEGFSELEETRGSLSDQLSLLQEARADQTHSLYNLPERWTQHQLVSQTVSAAGGRLEAAIAQWKEWDASYQTADSVLLSGQLADWADAVTVHGLAASPLAVTEFLMSAGQSQLAQQCEEMDALLRERAERLLMPLQSSISALRQLAALLPYLPPSQLRASHRVRYYLAWLTALRQQLTVDRLDEVRSQFRSVLGSEPYSPQKALRLTEVRTQYQIIQAANQYRIQELEQRLGGAEPAQLLSELQQLQQLVTSQQDEEAGELAASRCTLMSAVYTAGRQLLRMEATAHGAGDKLVELTSQEGRWFVDELCASVAWLARLGRMVPCDRQTEPQLQRALDDLQAAEEVTAAIQDLKSKFAGIILPEGIRYAQQEEISVLATIQAVSDVISSAGVPLTELIGSLEQYVRHLVLGMSSEHQVAAETARALLLQYRAQVDRPDGQMTQGQMLLMGFNILFETLDSKVEALVGRLSTAREWASVDMVREASAIMPPLRNAAAREALHLMTFLLRLELLQNFFTKCLQNAAAYTGVEMAGMQLSVCSDAQLTSSLRRCVAGHLRRSALGVTSLLAGYLTCSLADACGLNVAAEVAQRDVGADSRVPLEELVRTALERCLAEGAVTSGQLARCQQRLSQLEAAWRQYSIVSALQQELGQCHRAAERYQLSEAAHQWLYSDLPGTAGTGRDLVLDQLSRAISAANRCPPVWELEEEFSQLSQSVEQRLRWAAGANAEVAQLLESQKERVRRCLARLSELRQLVAAVAELGRGVLHAERLRGRGAEPAAEDSRFIQLLGEMQEAARLGSEPGLTVTPLEQKLTENVPPPADRVTTAWIQQATARLTELQQKNQEALSDRQSELFVCWDEIRSHVIAVRDLLTAHHKLISDVRLLLKSIAKASGDCIPAVEAYMTQYRTFSEELSRLIRNILNETVSRDNVQRYAEHLGQVQASTESIYDTLLSLASQLSSVTSEESRLTPREKTVQKDKHTGRGVQGCNQYALAVWRRVRQKLEGCDPDPTRAASVPEQVEFTIQEATSATNLALLYEGWTPWV